MVRNLFDGWHIVVVAVVILLLFGWKKMPDMARSFGRSARILRSEVDEMKNDKKSETTGQGAHATAQPANSAQHPTPATPAGSVPGVPAQPDVPAKDPAGRNTVV